MCNTIPQEKYCIIFSADSHKAEYAKTELEKYIYLLTGSTVIDASCSSYCHISFVLNIDPKKPELGEEGYEIHTSDDLKTVTISAFTDQGLLYGVYGLLEEHYGVGFYFSGDAIPQQNNPLELMPIHERRIPEQYIRGFLPWTNFPQSATSYSVQDWIFIIDQMTRMRMNFINIHNYNGEFGHNEVFHNIMQNGEMSRNWNATVSRPHAWGMKGWDVNEYLFGGTELFDDYDFGADATLHNDCLGNIDVFKKGSSEFKIILEFAKKRGVKIGLGLDLNLVASDYGDSADNSKIAKARINQIITDYSNLDYLMLYRSENSPDFDVWNNAFQTTYNEIKAKAANIRIAVSGWGLDPDTIIGLPKDVIAAPISGHAVNDKFPDGNIYGEREFWACPWAERDYNDSVHFAPYRTYLSNTIDCYQNRSNNTKGLMMLTWRISDAVDAKLSYVAKAPWDEKNLLSTSKAAYEQYAKKCYGSPVSEEITKIINQNEAYATNASECLFTPQPSLSDRSSDISKANEQLATIDAAIAATSDKSWIERLKKLRCRIQAVKSFCILDQDIDKMSLLELEGEFSIFVKSFIDRIDDISTLGNLFSIENRYVHEWFCDRVTKLDEWKNKSFSDCMKPSKDSLRVLMISPITSLDKSNIADFKAIVLNTIKPETLVVSLFWRIAGNSIWNVVPMERRVKNIFGVRVQSSQFPDGIIEYCIKATEESCTAYYPETAPTLCMAISKKSEKAKAEINKPELTCEGERLRWSACDGDVIWYRIYRGTVANFEVGPQSLVTYVYRDTLTYCDISRGFDGKRLDGDYYYKITAVNLDLSESEPSIAVLCKINPPKIIALNSDSIVGDKTVSLGKITLNENDKFVFLGYGATHAITAEVWVDEVSSDKGTLVGNTTLCSTGMITVSEIGEIPLNKTIVGTHDMFITIRQKPYAQCKIDSFYLGKNPLREPVITTNADSFSIDKDCNQLCLLAQDNESFSIKTLDGHSPTGVNIDNNGVLTMKKPQAVRVISKSTQGIIRERLVTSLNPVKEMTTSVFERFWLISGLIGCDEAVEVGGLPNGYDYVCELKHENKVIFKPTRCSSGAFKIPSSVLWADNSYEITVIASNPSGYRNCVTRSIKVSTDGIHMLNDKTFLGVSENSGECEYNDEWNIKTEGHYDIISDGLRLTTRKGDKSARFTFCLPPYTQSLPHFLIKAEGISGNWTFQLNGIPIVGAKENNVAVRKDMRTFGFTSGQKILLSLMISTDEKSEFAETVFKSVQFLPDHD